MGQLLKLKRKNTILKRQELINFYRSKYYSFFINNYRFPQLDAQQTRFMLSQYWETGTICAYVLEESRGSAKSVNPLMEEKPLLLLFPYAPYLYNIYNFATHITPIRLRGAKFIPARNLVVGKECVLGWGHSSHMPIRYFVDTYIEKIVDVEMTLRMNLSTHKLSRLIVCSPEDKARLQTIMDKIEAGEEVLYVEVSDVKAISNILQSGEYIVDKLYAYKLNLEKELMTFFGMDNVGMVKRERENVDETNANNEEIDQGGDCFLDELKTFCKDVTDILGYELSVEEKQPRVQYMETPMTEKNSYTQDKDNGGN